MNNLSSAPARSAPCFVNCESMRELLYKQIFFIASHQQRCNAS